MKKLHLIFLAILIAPSLSFAVPQDSAIDKDKVRNDTRNQVNWKTTRTGEYDVPWTIVTNSDGSAISAGGGGGGAATIADGADVTQGAKADSAATTDTGTFTSIALTKRGLQKLTTISGQLPAALGATTSAGSISITPASDAGMATSANQSTANTSLNSIDVKTPALSSGAVPVVSSIFGTGTVVSSTALEASHILKASSGTLVSLVGYNSKSSAQFIQVFNSTTVPADTTVPIVTFTVPATSNFSYDVPHTGLPFATGISFSNSSTAATKTIGSADVFITAVVK